MGLQAWKDYQWSRLSQVQSNNTSQFQFIEVQYECMYFNHVSGLYTTLLLMAACHCLISSIIQILEIMKQM
jgi:hypothetical protein